MQFSKNEKINIFWQWFSRNSDTYFHFEKNQNFLFTQLKSELSKINPDLVFEFSKILDDGKRNFVISADGIRDIFPIVNDLVDNAPLLHQWHIIAFRQPRIGLTHIQYGGLVISFNDVFFRYQNNNRLFDIELHIRGFFEAPEWTGAAFIILDNVIGEYYTEMYIGCIDKKRLNDQDIPRLYPLIELPKIIKAFITECQN